MTGSVPSTFSIACYDEIVAELTFSAGLLIPQNFVTRYLLAGAAVTLVVQKYGSCIWKLGDQARKVVRGEDVLRAPAYRYASASCKI